MKNFFHFAHKELTQDTFLRWVFENWKTSPFNKIVDNLLYAFCGISKAKIKSITTEAQEKYIDLKISICLENGTTHTLFIEDKAFSSEHSQLENYNAAINAMNLKNVHKVYYKTNLLDTDEKERVKNAKWDIFDIEKIYPLFAPFQKCGNFLVEQYVEYLKDFHTIATDKNSPKPTQNSTKLDLLKWFVYFSKIAKEFEKNKGKFKYINKCKVLWPNGRYDYVRLCLTYAENAPYIEVRSRECTGDKFSAKLVFYGVDEDATYKNNPTQIYIKQQQLDKDANIENNATFTTKRRTKKSAFWKQYAKHDAGNVTTNNEFLCELEKCAKAFDEIIKFW